MALTFVMNLQVGERILCRHPFNESKRAYVVPKQVEELLKCYWPGNSGGILILFSVINQHFPNSYECPSSSLLPCFPFDGFLFFPLILRTVFPVMKPKTMD